MSFNSMAAVPICSDFRAQNRKSLTASSFSSSTCHEVMGPDAAILVFRMLSFQPTFFTLLFHPHRDALCPSSLSVIRVVSPAHLRLLMFLPVILISARNLFKKTGDIKGTFHARMGTIKDRNCMDLTETEEIKKRQQECTEELYKKDLHDPDNHHGVLLAKLC